MCDFWSAHAQRRAFDEDYDKIVSHMRYNRSSATTPPTRHALATVLMQRRSPVPSCHCDITMYFMSMPYHVIRLPSGLRNAL